MSEEKKQQVERISTAVGGLDTSKQETALAFMQGMAAGARMAEATKKEANQERRPRNDKPHRAGRSGL